MRSCFVPVLGLVMPFVGESVDLVELNHFHDAQGHSVYSQVIFWEWSPSDNRYETRAWKLVGDDLPREGITTSNGFCRVRWFDKNERLSRVITAPCFRESWTQHDPERLDRSNVPEHERRALIKRSLSPLEPAELELAEVE